MIHVVAVLTTKPGERERVLGLFRDNMPKVHAEAGCIEYVPAVDAEGSADSFGPDSFVVIEKWESMEALRAHAASAHMQAYGAASRPYLADRKVHVLTGA